MKINQNEITGAYYEEKTDWLIMLFRIRAVTGGIVAIVIIGAVLLNFVDKIVGAEQVTYWIANLVG